MRGRTTSNSHLDGLTRLFKALTDETRLKIIKLLGHGELCVCDIVAAFDMSQPKVSFHLAALKSAGILKDRREGKWMHYSLNSSDLLTRLLVLSVSERITDEHMRTDLERLEAFVKTKGQALPVKDGCSTAKTGRPVRRR